MPESTNYEELEQLANLWVDMAFTQTSLHSIPGEASAFTLRLCADMLRGIIRKQMLRGMIEKKQIAR